MYKQSGSRVFFQTRSKKRQWWHYWEARCDCEIPHHKSKVGQQQGKAACIHARTYLKTCTTNVHFTTYLIYTNLFHMGVERVSNPESQILLWMTPAPTWKHVSVAVKSSRPQAGARLTAFSNGPDVWLDGSSPLAVWLIPLRLFRGDFLTSDKTKQKIPKFHHPAKKWSQNEQCWVHTISLFCYV